MDKFWELQQSLEKQAKGDDVGLDVEYDGVFHPAGSGAGFVRERVKEVRELVNAVQAGEATLEVLCARVERIQQGMETAREQILEIAEGLSGRSREACLATAAAFEHGGDGLKSMIRAVAADDLEGLLAGQEMFEASVRELDELVAEEAQSQSKS